MTVQADQERGDRAYNEFYREGGWKYSFWREFLRHRRHFVKAFGLRRGMRILEIASGNGFHTHLLNRMGFDCVGIDRSREGIAWARSHYPRWTYHQADADESLPFPRRSFDVVYARGFSNYHYDLSGEKAMGSTQQLIDYVKPGGVFIMVIATDLSGRREPDRIWHNTLSDYERHFSSFHRRWSVRWHKGMVVCGLWNAPMPAPAQSPRSNETNLCPA